MEFFVTCGVSLIKSNLACSALMGVQDASKVGDMSARIRSHAVHPSASLDSGWTSHRSSSSKAGRTWILAGIINASELFERMMLLKVIDADWRFTVR